MKSAHTLAAAAALAITSTAAQANTRIVANCFFPPQHFTCQDVMKVWGDEVERVTEGRVRVNTPAKSMAPRRNSLPRSGAASSTRPSSSTASSRMKRWASAWRCSPS